MWQTKSTNKSIWNDRFQVDVSVPENGMGLLISSDASAVESEAANTDLMRIHSQIQDCPIRLELIESYLRGTDFVATYAPAPPDQAQPQIYWRGLECQLPGCWGIEVMLSIQTSLLDRDPGVSVGSRLPAGQTLSWRAERWQLFPKEGVLRREDGDSGLFLVRPAGCQWSYAEAAFPADFVETLVGCDATRSAWSHWLFSERMEKGVIRRGRIAGWIVPRANDEELALNLWQTFCHSPPPLTT